MPPERDPGRTLGFGPEWAKTLELRIEALEPDEGGGTVVHVRHTGWPHEAADGEMAMCGYTWAMIVDRLAGQVARGECAPYVRATAPLSR